MLDNEFHDEMLADFIDESDGLLQQLNENLLELDEWVKSLDEGETAKCDIDLMNEMFRAAHSIKGLSGMLGLDSINTLTHKVENVFDAARNDELNIGLEVVELVLQAVDRLNDMVDGLKECDGDEVDCSDVVEGIRVLLDQSGAGKANGAEGNIDDLFAPGAEETASDTPVETPAETPVADVTPDPTPVETVDHFTDLKDEQDISDKYLSIFIAETVESLDLMSEVLLAEANADTTEQLLITCHRIKGSAASLGLNRPAKLSHLMEDVLQDTHQQGATLGVPAVDALLACTDALRDYVDKLLCGSSMDNCNAFQAAYCKLQQASEGGSNDQPTESHSVTPAAEPVASDSTAKLIGETRSSILAMAPQMSSGIVGVVSFQPNLPLVEMKACLVCEKVIRSGELFFSDPAEEDIDAATDMTELTFGVVTTTSESELRSHLMIEGVVNVELSTFACEETVTSETPVDDASPQNVAAPIEPTASNSAAPTSKSSAQPAAATSDETKATAKSAKPAKQAAPQKTLDEAKASDTMPADAKKSKKRGEEKAARNGDGGKKKPAETLRVDIERLDQLMNLAGQLVINKARFGQIGDGLKSHTSSKQASMSLASAMDSLTRLNGEMGSHTTKTEGIDFASIRRHVGSVFNDLEMIQRELTQLTNVRSLVNELGEAVHQLDRVTDGIQKSVMDTRMVPIGPLFGRFRRVVRDITQRNGKAIELVIQGEKTELDKRMIDELGDPLIHMIRNSCDHGVELPEDRVAAGKPRNGVITLDAFHRGNRIVIQIKDDGKGIDPDKILNKALDRELVTEKDAAKMTPNQIYQLIWEPGFSTAEKVTEVSGRGMGMDIVRSKIESLSGTVELESEPGVGSTFTIKLPLTMAILPSLLADIEGDIFAVPVESVVEIVSIEPHQLNNVHGVTTAQVRGRVISVVELEDLFVWRQPRRRSKSKEQDENTTLVIVGLDGNEVGLVVNHLLGEEDIVIKSLAENYNNVAGVAGASILGDGRVSLILDVASILDALRHGARFPSHETETAGAS